ncbi:SepM family pheromone-processing serine protease [Alkalibacterium sp. MB6]|uniref:SepM family pheromone-processing serine protease n=1 Tax=Alkalibacterium sp. MB6 TaxID=2081965 RepID=UPI001379ED45|nr:SepM family pheromone-processing serine protease [Alkalibacterium sp. MB6]
MKNNKRLFKGLFIVIAIYLLVFQPIPYYIERPGSAIEVNSMVEVNGEGDESEGEFMMTTVEMLQATPLSSLLQLFPYHTVLGEEELLGNVEDYDAYRLIQNYYMTHSKNTAKAAAFNAADLPYQLEFFGVYVMSISQESDFSDSLEIGDSILSIDGQAFANTEEFIQYIADKDNGDTVTLTVERESEVFKASGELVELAETGNPGIGISLVTRSTVQTEPSVSIESGSIGGPSAGLMFALQIYSMITEEPIRGDHTIAGTGTITEDGLVGRIGGVDKKVVAADREGASVFFVPDDEADALTLEYFPDYKSNYEVAVEAAEDIDTEMEIVPVKHISDAIAYLNELNDMD